MNGRRTIVRLASASIAVLVILVYGIGRGRVEYGEDTVYGRKLLSIEEEDDVCKTEGHGNDQDNANCTTPLNHGNDSCQFVYDNCGDDVQLFDYLAFVACDLPYLQWLGFIILALWLLYLISLLATTADYFFVPPLDLLATKLKLSPSIAGITLLAIGNGAPDVFTAFSALKGGDLPLVLGALIGASIFISTIVLGSVILITNVTSDTIDKIDFIRDVIAYMVVVGAVIGVAFDGEVNLYEAILFPIIYVSYIAIAVIISYVRSAWAKKHPVKVDVPQDNVSTDIQVTKENGVQSHQTHDETTPLLDDSVAIKEKINENEERLELAGLTWPKGRNILVKFQWFIELPFSLLRWISIPPCCHDGKWSRIHAWFVIGSPVPMIVILTVAGAGWDGFTSSIGNSEFPYIGLFLIIGVLLSIVLFFVVSRTRPHWIVQLFLGVAGFVMSIAWLNIEANEVVSVLESFGLAFNIDTAILGLTVLAIGNSVGDWVADTAVARAGSPGMGVASCFGSPLLNDVLGLSVALIAKIGIYDRGKSFIVCINNPEYVKVKLSWIFLSISLVMSAIVFPLFKFSPPRSYGIVLIYIYVVFMVFSVLDEVKVLKFNL